MKKWLAKIIKAAPFSLLATLLIGITVLAAAYSAPLTITETNGTAYDMLPVIADAPVQWMVDNDYMDADGLDTLVETAGGVTKPHMVADDKVLTATATPANSQTNLVFSTENTPLSSMDIITGYDGCITIPDDATLELGSDFEIERSGYVDTDAGSDKNLVFKDDACRTYIDGATNVTSTIDYGSPYFPVVEATNGGTNLAANNHTVDLPAGIVSGDLLLVVFNCDGLEATTYPGGWTGLFEKQDGGADGNTLSAAYRVADGGEGASITVTTAGAEDSAYQTYRISGYSGVPEVGTSAVGDSDSPNPPSLAPSWGATTVSTLWLAIAGWDGLETVNVYPANYTDGLDNTSAGGADACGCGSARREFKAASDDPGVFTLSGGNHWIANTIAIAPEDLEITATGISSGEYTVKTYGVDNEPAWATGDVLHFDGTATSNINCGAIHNASAKLWISFWFRLDNDFNDASPGIMYLFGKYIAPGDDQMVLYLNNSSGQLMFEKYVAGPRVFRIVSTETSWNASQWYHVLASISNVNGARLRIDNGTVRTNADVTAAPNGGDLVFGARNDGSSSGLEGNLFNAIVGTDDLTTDEEAALYAGTAPADAVNYWYIDEGTDTDIVDYGTGGNDGTADTACTWETSTYTTGKTGRLCDFYIEIDDGVTDPDRWGANLKGASVPDNANDWKLNQNNVMPYMDYYKHTVSGVEHAWYQPDYVVETTSYDGTADAGSSDVKIIDAELTQTDDYWNNALLTITETTDHNAPEGETTVITDFLEATDELQFAALTATVDAGDTYTVDFGTLIDRSYYGLGFDGTDDYVTLPDDALLAVSEGTFEAWIYPTKSCDIFSVVKDSSNYVRLSTTGADLHIDCKSGGVLQFDGNTTANEVTYDTWHHIVWTKTGTTHTLYVDNNVNAITWVDETDKSAWWDDVPTVAQIRLGRTSVVAYFADYMDEIRIYDRAITADEVEYNYNGGVGRYTPYSSTGLLTELHAEDGSGLTVTDTSGEGNDGTIQNETYWTNGYVPRPAGNSGTNDSRITWGVNPTGVGAILSSLVSEDQPGLATPVDEPARDVMPEIETSDWFVEPDIGGSLATNPVRPFITMISDNTTLTELQTWRWLGIAVVLLVTVTAARLVPKHLAIACFAGGAGTLLMVVMTIWPPWALVLLILFAFGGWVSERAPSI